MNEIFEVTLSLTVILFFIIWIICFIVYFQNRHFAKRKYPDVYAAVKGDSLLNKSINADWSKFMYLQRRGYSEFNISDITKRFDLERILFRLMMAVMLLVVVCIMVSS